ncbi:MAG: hypothetical protein ABR968_10730, partial [Bacteroidales bacterium]
MKNIFPLIILLIFTVFKVNSQPGCPNINAGPDQTVTCASPCANLTATYLATGATTSYSVTSIPYAPPAAFNVGTAVLVHTDDLWAPVVTLPFPFCFYGTQYNSVVIGSNELFSFDATANVPGAYCSWPLTSGATLPTSTFPVCSIMGPYQDIDPTNSGGIYYQLIGTSPCRMLVVSFYDVPYFGGTGSVSTGSCPTPPIYATSMIVLYENTNVIEIYIQNKPDCAGWNGGLAIEGIQDDAGVNAAVVPGRNNTVWTATNDAWRFTPNGAPNYTISWWQGATFISNNATINVCPATTTTYTAQIIYTLCSGGTLTLQDDATVTVNNSIGLTINPLNPVICGGGSTTLTANSTDPTATFQWSSPPGGTSTSITVSPTTTTTYTVTATTTGCTTQTSATVTVSTNPTVTVNSPSICIGQSTTLTANGATSYVWNTGDNTSSITVSPTVTTTYTVTGSNSGCTGIGSGIVTVSANLVPTITGPSSICLGNTATLNA